MEVVRSDLRSNVRSGYSRMVPGTPRAHRVDLCFSSHRECDSQKLVGEIFMITEFKALFVFASGAFLVDENIPEGNEHTISDPISSKRPDEVAIYARKFVKKAVAFPYIIFIEVV